MRKRNQETIAIQEKNAVRGEDKSAEFYQAEGADELVMLDIAATLENRKTRLEWAKAVSAVIDIPLTVGGGIASLQDIDMTLKACAKKVSMNSEYAASIISPRRFCPATLVSSSGSLLLCNVHVPDERRAKLLTRLIRSV